ncbi:MAG TPA: transposase [Pseudonocardiaceae bacterium]|nr:transposase [Pseudonocardiaceae bacterium]
MILPPSWVTVLETMRPAFRRRGTSSLFCVLATGLVAQTSRRSVVGMLSGARMAERISFHAACRFFSHAMWDIDQLGVLTARLIVDRLLGDDEPITVVVDDTLFKRWGRKVHHAFWTHDGPRRAARRSPGVTGGRWPGSWCACRCARPRCVYRVV